MHQGARYVNSTPQGVVVIIVVVVVETTVEFRVQAEKHSEPNAEKNEIFSAIDLIMSSNVSEYF